MKEVLKAQILLPLWPSTLTYDVCHLDAVPSLSSGLVLITVLTVPSLWEA
jgi:hypothetical protein